ncbi:hypothetical protein VYU27_005748 [Nannochloropsis oceanica]
MRRPSVPGLFSILVLFLVMAAAHAMEVPSPSSPLMLAPPPPPPPSSSCPPSNPPPHPPLSWYEWLTCRRLLQEWKAVAYSSSSSSASPHAVPRPFVTLAYAQSLDGCVATEDKKPTAISGPAALVLTHDLRALHDCILIGAGTLQSDNPRLNVRLSSCTSSACPVSSSSPPSSSFLSTLLSFLLPSSPLSPNPSPPSSSRCRDPRPVLLLSSGRGPLPFDLSALRLSRPPLIFTPSLSSLLRRLPGGAKGELYRSLTLKGYEFIECAPSSLPSSSSFSSSRCCLVDVLRQLKEKWGYERVMVEGGAGVLTSFLEGGGGGGERDGLVDVCVVTIAPSFVGNGYKLIQTDGKYYCNIKSERGEVKKKNDKNKMNELRGKNEGGGERGPWLVRLGEGGRKGGGWHVHRLGRDIVVVGRPQWPRGDAGQGEGRAR